MENQNFKPKAFKSISDELEDLKADPMPSARFYFNDQCMKEENLSLM